MKKAWPILIVLTIFTLSCNDESLEVIVDEQSLIGHWNYQKVFINGVATEDLEPSFTISNFLLLKEDYTYGKCYINGSWSLSNLTLKLKNSAFAPIRSHKVLSLSQNTLILQIELTQSEYGIGFPQFDTNEVLTIVETFERVE